MFPLTNLWFLLSYQVANNVGPIFIRKVTSAQGKAMASQLDIGYIEACPKSPPMNVPEVFSRLCEMIKKFRQQVGRDVVVVVVVAYGVCFV